MDRDLLNTLREVNKNPIQMLNSTEYWKGEDIGAAKQALDYSICARGDIPCLLC